MILPDSIQNKGPERPDFESIVGRELALPVAGQVQSPVAHLLPPEPPGVIPGVIQRKKAVKIETTLNSKSNYNLQQMTVSLTWGRGGGQDPPRVPFWKPPGKAQETPECCPSPALLQAL